MPLIKTVMNYARKEISWNIGQIQLESLFTAVYEGLKIVIIKTFDESSNKITN